MSEPAPSTPAASQPTQQPATAPEPAANPAPSAPSAQPAAQAQTPAPKAAETPAKVEKPTDETESAQVRELRAELHARIIREKVMESALAARAIAPEDVLALVGPQLSVTNGEVRVKGQPDKDVGAYLSEWFRARPHMLAPTVPAGGSGAPAAVQPPVQAAPVDLRSAQGATSFVQGFSHQLFGLRMQANPPTPASAAPSGSSTGHR